ncbi:MAG: TIGR04013 family B12-binding domain/radical SAM domain-containing protein, partial [Candidatus Ranarchaeia archaeon]
YPPFAPRHALFGPFEISRGCPGSCKYCQVTPLFGNRMRHRSVDRLLIAAKQAVTMRYQRLWFLSPNAFAYGSRDGVSPNPNETSKLLESLSEIPGLSQIYFGTFPSEVRPDSVTMEMLEIVKQYAANSHIVIGAQTGSNRLLKHIGRGHSVEDILNAVSLLTDAGLTGDFDFIFGLPTENHEDQLNTIDLIQSIVKAGHRIHAHAFLPLPGTIFEKEQPGHVDPLTRRLLGNLTRKKQAYGSWSHQIYLAEQLQK